ncbi:MAG: hypothetical protein Q7S92_03865 [Candidatus Diapherotrites archaeon]|nr:hypothetical protein [Candidatus Diapherotrites archaeon]
MKLQLTIINIAWVFLALFLGGIWLNLIGESTVLFFFVSIFTFGFFLFMDDLLFQVVGPAVKVIGDNRFKSRLSAFPVFLFELILFAIASTPLSKFVESLLQTFIAHPGVGLQVFSTGALLFVFLVYLVAFTRLK